MIPILDSTATKKKTGRTAIDKEALQNAAKEAHKHQKEKMEFEGETWRTGTDCEADKVEPSQGTAEKTV